MVFGCAYRQKCGLRKQWKGFFQHNIFRNYIFSLGFLLKL